MNEIDPNGFDFLGDVDDVVFKIGGVNAADVLGTMNAIQSVRETGRRVLPVFSAPRSDERNSTDSLVEAGLHAREQGADGLGEKLDEVVGFMKRQLLSTVSEDGHSSMVIEHIVDKMLSDFRPHALDAAAMPAHWKPTHFLRHGRDLAVQTGGGQTISFTGLGERISAAVYTELLGNAGEDVDQIDTADLSDRLYGFDQGQDPFELLKKPKLVGDHVGVLKPLLAGNSSSIVCLPGYAPGAAYSKGYSDVLAMLVAKALERSRALLVGKQYAILSLDPRIGLGQLVPVLGKDFTLRLFEDNGANAGALHPDAVKHLSPDFDIFVGNPGALERGVSRITARPLPRQDSRVEAIAITKIPAAVQIQGGGMIDRPDVMKAILDEFGGVPVGHTLTDAHTVLVTFNDAKASERYDQLKRALDDDAGFEVTPVEAGSQAWVHCLGNRVDLREKSLAGMALADGEIDSAWGTSSPDGVKFLVDALKAKKAVAALHAALIRPYS